MSEWAPLAAGRGEIRRAWENYGGPYGTGGFPALHILQQDNNAPSEQTYRLYASAGNTARFNVVPEPTYFGNSRPNLLSASLLVQATGRPFEGSENLYSPRGSVRLMLCRNPERTEGVWVELSQDIIGHSWRIDDGNSATRVVYPGSAFNEYALRAYGSIASGIFSTPLPSAMMARGFSLSRVVRFGVIGSAAIGQFSLNQFSGYQEFESYNENTYWRHIPFCIAVVQRDGAPTATVAVGDMSDLSWHYVFNSGMSFVPTGECLPQTYAAVEIYANPYTTDYPLPGRTVFSESPTVWCNKLWMASVGRSDRHAHNGHYPTDAIVFGRANDGPALYKPAHGAAESATRAVAYGATGYTTQREQFELGVAAIPSLPSAGHWTVIPTTGPIDGDMQLTLQNNTPADENARWSVAGAIGYTLTLGKTDAAGVALTHNCAHAQVSNINRDSTIVRYGVRSAAPLPPIGSSNNYDIYAGSYLTPATWEQFGILPINYYTITCNVSATLAAWQSAVDDLASLFSAVSLSSGGYNAHPIRYVTTFEEYATLRDMQGFGRLHYGKGSAAGYGPYMDTDITSLYGYFSEVLPNGPTIAEYATSGNADAWASGAPAAVKASKRRLMIDALIRVVGLRRWRTVKVYTPRWVADTETRIKMDGWLEIPKPDLEGAILSEWQEFLSAHYQFSEAASDALRSGLVATVPAGVLKSITQSSEFSAHYTMLEKLYGLTSSLDLDVSLA